MQGMLRQPPGSHKGIETKPDKDESTSGPPRFNKAGSTGFLQGHQGTQGIPRDSNEGKMGAPK